MLKTIPQLKTRIIRLVGVILAAVLCISAWNLYVQYNNAVDFAERQATDYARALAEHSESAFADADRVLRDSVYDLKREGGVDRLDRRALFAILQRNAENTPQIGSMFIADKKGNMLANSTTFPQPPISIGDREYFNRYLTTLGADLTFSRTAMGRLVARWRFNLVRPLTDSGNNFNGVIAVAFEADYFNKFMNPASLGRRGRVLLIRDDGAPLVSEPYETNAYKADFRATDLFNTKLPASSSGTYHDSLGTGDTESRIISYQHLDNFPVVAVVALHKGDILAPWAWKALFQSLMTIGLCIVIVVMTRIMFRQMDSLERARSAVSKLEEDLLHLQKVEALGQMAGSISHDFNNLLTPILVYAEMIRRGLPEDHRQLRRVDGIITAANRARDLNQRLISFGSKQALRMESLDLNDVIASFRNIMRSTLPENIAIDVKNAPGAARIRADRNQLEQVLLGLAANAHEAIEGSGTISVTTSRVMLDEEYVRHHPGMAPGSYILVEIMDDGCGMDDETLSHVYEPFFTTRSTGRGAGLGLAAAYGIIKQHGGCIRIDSRPGEGTSVRIHLPLAAEEPFEITTSAQAGNNSSHAFASATILLVEDDLMVREMAIDLLESEGFKVLVADSPTKAREIERTFTGTIDLLLTDVVMPEMNGVELYKSLLYSRPGMPVLYISGYDSAADINNMILEGNLNFIKKPFSVELFIEKVKQVTGSR